LKICYNALIVQSLSDKSIKEFIDWDERNKIQALPGDLKCLDCEIILHDGRRKRVYLLLVDANALKGAFHTLEAPVDAATIDRVTALVQHLFTNDILENHVAVLPESFYLRELKCTYIRQIGLDEPEWIPVFQMTTQESPRDATPAPPP